MNRLTLIRSIPKDAKILIFSNSFRSFSSALLAVCFPIYLNKIGAPAILIGLTFMGIILFSAIRSLIEGVVADKIGRKPILLFIAASLIAGGVIFVATTNITILLAAAVLFTVGGTITYTPAEVALLSDNVSDGNRTMTYSVNATLATIASILGSFAGALPEALKRVGVICLIPFTFLKDINRQRRGLREQAS